MRMRECVMVGLLMMVSGMGWAQLPDAPSALMIRPVAPARIPMKEGEHKFWDRQQKVSFWVSAGLRTVDVVNTCRDLNTWHLRADGSKVIRKEVWMPTRSCGATAALIGGGQAGQVVVGYWLHKRGHHRLERWVPWVASMGTSVAIAYSVKGDRR